MLGAILIVSGPTVIAPILDQARPRRHVRSTLWWEGITIGPIGAIIGVLVFHAIKSGLFHHPGEGIRYFLANISVGLVGGAIGAVVLWILLRGLKLSGALATQGIVATVVLVAASCNAIRDESGLLAALEWESPWPTSRV